MASLLPLCLSYAFMHSLVINWLIRAVFPTPLAPSIATVYEVISFAGTEFFSSPSGSVGASEFDLDLLLLNESPLLMIPATRQYIHNCFSFKFFSIVFVFGEVEMKKKKKLIIFEDYFYERK